MWFFYLKLVPLGPSSCGWIKFFLTLWCLEQKKEAPKASDAYVAPFKGIFPLLTKMVFFLHNIFLQKFFHFITEHLDHIWVSLLLSLWCLDQKRGALKASDAFGAPFKGYFPSFHQEVIFFFLNFFYKSFPFYNWTFGGYFIFINV